MTVVLERLEGGLEAGGHGGLELEALAAGQHVEQALGLAPLVFDQEQADQAREGRREIEVVGHRVQGPGPGGLRSGR